MSGIRLELIFEGFIFVSAHYRADIDGLRALAVVPVVLFHIGAPVFAGGFVGVDIFFVISGYLITSIILPEIDAGNFSIAKFYERRARRIFPALFSILLFCAAAGFVVMAPSDYNTLGQSIIAAALFVSNIFFWRQTNYFTGPANESPLLHTWSLAIEEQFYLFYPLLLKVIPRSARVQFATLAFICAVSFFLGAVLVFFKPSATFYLGPTRAWELLVGGLIVLTPTARRGFACSCAAAIGAALIAFSIFAYSSSMRFPGTAALAPTLGAALIIWSGVSTQTAVHRVLALPLMTAIGKASYSLYLWHFPLIAFASYVELAGLSWSTKAALCVALLAISFLSLNYIERPFRQKQKPAGVRRPVTVATSGMVLACTVGIAISSYKGFPSRLDLTSTTYLDAELDKDRHHMECLSWERKIVHATEACKLGFREASPHVLLWGDSHAVVTGSAMEQAANRNRASFLLAASVDCPIGIGFGIDRNVGSDLAANPGYQHCEDYNKEMLQVVESRPDLDTVVLSSRWTNWKLGEPGSAAEAPVDIRLRDEGGTASTPEENKRIFVRGFEALLRQLVNAQKTIWVIGPLPEPSFRIPKALFIEHLGLDRTDLQIPLAAFQHKNKFILSTLMDLQQKFPIQILLPHLALCDGERCAVSVNGRPLYLDDNHLSLQGAQQTSLLYDRIFQNQRQAHRD
ncbi:acyltransferase family protein [Bradyrhizobium genosp. A]|uniref:acyltransferase family protein n=1 Tax=Bradyrhizobium genosp. A TaxID=83626 RepID=UPI003CED5620